MRKLCWRQSSHFHSYSWGFNPFCLHLRVYFCLLSKFQRADNFLLSELMSCNSSNQTEHRDTEKSAFSHGSHGSHTLLWKWISAHQMLHVAAALFISYLFTVWLYWDLLYVQIQVSLATFNSKCKWASFILSVVMFTYFLTLRGKPKRISLSYC